MFEERGAELGIEAFTSSPSQGNGVAAADLGDDGDVDFFVANGPGVADQLYRNLGGGQLEEVASALGVASLGNTRAGLFFDHDGDNRLDLLVAADCYKGAGGCAELKTLTLYEQAEDGSFRDITAAAGLEGLLPLDEDQHIGGLTAGDLDGDGDLEVYVAEWKFDPFGSDESLLLRNNGDGTFSDVTIGSGLEGTSDGRWQPVMWDFNGDGLLDIYSAVDFLPNRLWINRGNLTFEDVAQVVGTGTSFHEMGTALGDPDNDGDIDIYNTNIDNLTVDPIQRQLPGFIDRYNVFFENTTVTDFPRFRQSAIEAGIAITSWGWGTTFLDADGDGWQDLVATNGFEHEPYADDTSAFFLNDGTSPLHFTDQSSASGFDDRFWGSSLVASDLDRDGDPDVIQTTVGGPLRVLVNATRNSNHWLTVRPRSQTANRRAIGATVRVTANGMTMTRPITAGISFMGQEPAEAIFGLGEASAAVTLTVEWPDGSSTTLNNVAADQVVDVMQNGCGPRSQKCICGDYNGDGAITSMDIAGVAMCANGLIRCDASVVDADGDSSTTALDIGGIVASVAGSLSTDALQCSRNTAP